MNLEPTQEDKNFASELQKIFKKYRRDTVIIALDNKGKSMLMSTLNRHETIRQLKDAREKLTDDIDDVWITK